jgi:ubiquinone/menaquinone biosynthesis C-methylase UbiE
MNDFEKKYYESEEFWKGNMIQDYDNIVRIQTTASMIPSDVTSLADIGCGNGVFVNYVKQVRRDVKLLGIDRSEKALSFVQTDKINGDIFDLPVNNESFDCVTCLQVLEHITADKYKVGLKELARISKKYLLISVPLNEQIENNVSTCPCCKTIFNNDLHLRSYSEADISDLFTPYGFTCVAKKNVVEKEELVGLKLFQILSLSRNKKRPAFHSPICPVCGFENEDFKINSGVSEKVNTVSRKRRNKIKDYIKQTLPKKKKEGYWIISLYQRV